MKKYVYLLPLVLVAVCGSAQAQSAGGVSEVLGGVAAAGGVAAGIAALPLGGNFQNSVAPPAPEINGSDASGLMLLLGGFAVLRGRRRTSNTAVSQIGIAGE